MLRCVASAPNSTPRGWDLPLVMHAAEIECGFPACAGKPRARSAPSRWGWVHPGVFAGCEAAVEADVDAFLRRGSVNAQDYETLLQTVHRRVLATATRVVQAVGAQRS